ncbi:hypothetical protein [Novosphingobium sp. JCM 18896]|uniref:hypothetical protein n=1 Tax=Novosphingobium sp. JCM 18896 TaxID=2989731 RepID=UPI002223B28A|nr:hypothetical protein [Novosphingobium sp. JCM 18896]MCW1431611.1 hypothetical protein [Novosphingobium sp. JCM 18896]
MKWLFLYVIFDVLVGGLQPKVVMRQAFDNEPACNAFGREIEREIGYKDNSLKSFSTCIPESAFQDRGLKADRVDGRN